MGEEYLTTGLTFIRFGYECHEPEFKAYLILGQYPVVSYRNEDTDKVQRLLKFFSNILRVSIVTIKNKIKFTPNDTISH